MYVPKGFHWIGPTSLILGGFFIRTQYGAHWDVFAFVQLPLAVVAAEWGAYLWKAGEAYQRYVTGTPQPEQPVKAVDWNTGAEVEPLPVYDNGLKPMIRVNGKPHVAYSQSVDLPKFDNERKVAKTLITQRNNNFSVDLTEEFWIKRGNFGESRDRFVAMKDKWVRHGVIYKVGERKNAPHDVKDWRKVRLIADGNPLPQ